MRVLVIGGGAREHALAWKLSQSPHVDAIFAAPGNPGTARLGTNLPIGVDQIEELAEAASTHQIDLTVVGPEAPLAYGIVDVFHARGLVICGPTREAARIESSKIWAKEIMNHAGVPTARAQKFSKFDEAKDAVLDMPLPVVIKADGLAAGKGVVVAQTHPEAVDALHDFMIDRSLGEAANEVLLEDFLIGLEVSLLAVTDGKSVVPLLPSCDYKRALDDDRGPNTGGMGAYCPVPSFDPDLMVEILRTVFQPVVDEMRRRGVEYRGVLFAGMILTPDGPRVLEFNCRFGDPEAQVVLPLLKSDLAELLQAAANGNLSSLASLQWHDGVRVGIVAASGGYPGNYRTGLTVSGLENLPDGCLAFHAGTSTDDDGNLVTAGGRVVTIVGAGATFTEARKHAYAGVQTVQFNGAQYRNDIALRESIFEN